MTTPNTPDISTFDNDPQLERTHANMAAAGVAIETRPIVDFWSFSATEKFVMPNQNGVPEEFLQYILFKRMTEADKSEFQTKTNKDIRVQNSTKDIKLNMNPALERAELLRISITGWKLFGPNHKGELVELAFDDKKRAEFIRQADPKIIQDLEQAIRDANPWMRVEATAEQIRETMAQLADDLVEAEQRELAK